jgi:hypothetical protein
MQKLQRRSRLRASVLDLCQRREKSLRFRGCFAFDELKTMSLPIRIAKGN